MFKPDKHGIYDVVPLALVKDVSEHAIELACRFVASLDHFPLKVSFTFHGCCSVEGMVALRR